MRLRELFKVLGNCCAECGEANVTLFTIDHVEGITWNRYKYRYDARVGRYWREFREGVKLRVLCLVCNGRFGRMKQLDAGTEDVTDQERCDSWLEQHPKDLPDAPF